VIAMVVGDHPVSALQGRDLRVELPVVDEEAVREHDRLVAGTALDVVQFESVDVQRLHARRACLPAGTADTMHCP